MLNEYFWYDPLALLVVAHYDDEDEKEKEEGEDENE